MTATVRPPGMQSAEARPGGVPANRQRALTNLGLAALGITSRATLFELASRVVTQAVDADLGAVWELPPGGTRLRMCSGAGWRPGAAACAVIGVDRESASGLALARDETIVAADLRAETRFRIPSLLLQHGIRSVATAVIRGRDHPWGTPSWGTVGAYRREPRSFSAAELVFLETIANTLALAIDRDDAERDLRRREREAALLAGEVTKLADERARLLAESLAAEDRTREHIAQILHDRVLQSLLTARQDLAKGIRAGRPELVLEAEQALTAAIGELRSSVTGLHPVRLERGGLRSALDAVAAYHSLRGGFRTTLEVSPRALGLHDQLVLSLVRELLSNAAQHAHARRVTVTVRRTSGGLVIELADDGIGMTPQRQKQAVEQGHVGLASTALRAEAIGGRFQLASTPGSGTRVRISLPVESECGSNGQHTGHDRQEG